MEDRQATAAAQWLLTEIGCHAEWARPKGPAWKSANLDRGCWYVIRSHDPITKMVSLEAGEEEVQVHIDGLSFRADLPEKTIVFSEGKWVQRTEGPPNERKWVAKCPNEHEHVIGGTPPREDEKVQCPECVQDYEWEFE